jgi:hypothetical protein
VHLGDSLLTRGVDYNIDYATGELEFLVDDVLSWNGSIQICYEYESWP